MALFLYATFDGSLALSLLIVSFLLVITIWYIIVMGISPTLR